MKKENSGNEDATGPRTVSVGKVGPSSFDESISLKEVKICCVIIQLNENNHFSRNLLARHWHNIPVF